MATQWDGDQFIASLPLGPYGLGFTTTKLEPGTEERKGAHILTFTQDLGSLIEGMPSMEHQVALKWHPTTMTLSIWMLGETGVPKSRRAWALEVVNEIANRPSGNHLCKVSVYPVGMFPQIDYLCILCGWEVGCWEASLTADETSIGIFRKLVLSMTFRVLMETINAATSLTTMHLESPTTH